MMTKEVFPQCYAHLLGHVRHLKRRLLNDKRVEHTFSIVICPKNNEHILQQCQEGQRPEDQ